MNKKIAILHDAFLYRGGGERLVTLMAKSLGADLVSGFFSEGSFDPRELGFTGKIIPLGKPVFMKSIRHMILKWRFFWKARILKKYDTVIFSGDCLEALWHIPKDTVTVYYCHTPPRYLYDFRKKYLKSLPFLVRPIFSLAFLFFARIYERNLTRFDHIITNSETVQKRLKDFTGYESEIIYPPIDTQRFVPFSRHREVRSILRSAAKDESDPENRNLDCHVDLSQEQKDLLAMTKQRGYFLSWARLSPPKRVDLIVDAFLEMPGENLIFTYGKNDPMKDEILAKIRNSINITAIESPDDDTLISLIQGARASIYISVEEDFGMSPVESMACGVPVIGADEGGLRETIIDSQTGLLIEVNKENLKTAIRKMTPAYAESLHEKCRERAEEFSLEKFDSKIREKCI